MSGRWSLNAQPAGEQLKKAYNRANSVVGGQPALYQLSRLSGAPGATLRIHPVQGRHTNALGRSSSDQAGSSTISVGSSGSGTCTAVAAAVAFGSAPALVHVTASDAHDRPAFNSEDLICQNNKQQHQHDNRHEQLLLASCIAVQGHGAAVHGAHCSNAASSAGASRDLSGRQANVANNSSQPYGSTTAGQRHAAVPLKYHITGCIKRCRCWQEVDAVVREYGPAFNIIHISAAITHLAQLINNPHGHQQQGPVAHGLQRQQPQQQQQQAQQDAQLVHGVAFITEQMDRQHKQLQLSLQQHSKHWQQQIAQQQQGLMQQQGAQQGQLQLVQQLCEQAVTRQHEAGARQVANMLWAVAQLSSSGQSTAAVASAALALAERAADLFDAADGQHLANMAYAAAKLQLPVGKAWVEGIQDAWLRHVLQVQLLEQQRQQFNEVGSSVGSQPTNSSASISFVQDRRDSARIETAVRQPPASAARTSVSPQAAATMMWALTHLEQQSSSHWLQQVVAAVAGSMAQWPSRSVAVFVWGCAKLGYKVVDLQASSSVDQSNALVSHQARGQHLSGQQKSEVQPTIAQQQQQQHHTAALQLKDAVAMHCQGFTYRDVSQILWAAATMQLKLTSPVVLQLLAAGSATLPQPQLKTASVQGGSSSNREMPCYVAHSVSLALYGLARLGVQAQQELPPLLLRPWLAALLDSSSSADSHCLASAAWAICKLGLASSCPLVLKAMMQAATQQLQQQHQQLPRNNGNSSNTEQHLLAAAAPAYAVSSRAIASLVWAASYCRPAPALGAAGMSGQPSADMQASNMQQLGRTAQQELLRRRQQQRLTQLLQEMHATQHATFTHTGTSLTAASSEMLSGARHSSSAAGKTAADAIQLAAVQLLVAAAGLLPLHAGEQPQQHGKQQNMHESQPGGEFSHQRQQQAALCWSLLDMSQVMAAACRMQLQLPDTWWQKCLGQLQQLLLEQQQLQHLQHPQIVQSLLVAVWALGKAGVLVSPQLMQTLQQASLRALQPPPKHDKQQQHDDVGPCLTPQGHAMLLVGFVRLCMAAGPRLPSAGYQTPPWRQRAQRNKAKASKAAAVSRNCFGSSNCSRDAPTGEMQSLEHLHFGTAHSQQQQQCHKTQVPYQEKLRRRYKQRKHRFRQYLQLQQHRWVDAAGLSTEWLQAYCVSASQQLPSFTATGTVAVLWGFGKLRYHPGSAFMAEALQCVQRQLPQLTARHIALLLWSLHRLQHSLDDVLLAAVMQAWDHQTASANKADIQQVQWFQQEFRHLRSSQQSRTRRNNHDQ